MWPSGEAVNSLGISGLNVTALIAVALQRDGSNPLESYGKDYLEFYFEHCVIGGPDAFVIGIEDISQSEIAIRRKLVREIAGMPARVWLASDRRQTNPAVDCTTVHQFMGR